MIYILKSLTLTLTVIISFLLIYNISKHDCDDINNYIIKKEEKRYILITPCDGIYYFNDEIEAKKELFYIITNYN